MTKTARMCAWCGGPIVPTSGRGRPRRYCRNSHRQRAYEARVAARRRDLSPDEVVISRRGWEAIRQALAQLQGETSRLAADLASGKSRGDDYARAVARLNAAVADLQEASEPRAAW